MIIAAYTNIIKLNLCRRQMPDVLWGRMFQQLCKAKGVKLGSGKGNLQAGKSKGDTMSSLASELGVDKRTAQRRMKAARELETCGDVMRDAGKRPADVQTAKRRRSYQLVSFGEPNSTW